MNGLTTHVLDTMRGIPSRRIKIELWSLEPPKLLKSVQTNGDGRVDAPLLAGDEMRAALVVSTADAGAGWFLWSDLVGFTWIWLVGWEVRRR